MSKPLGRSVLVDETFFDALIGPDAPRHGEALGRYEELLADYESGTTVLVTHDQALANSVDPARARRIAAICDIVPIEGDVRREIRRIRSDDAAHDAEGLDDSQLATIVLLVRCAHDELVSFNQAVAAAAAAAITEHRVRRGRAGRRFGTRRRGPATGDQRS